MKLIENLKTICDIVKETKKTLTLNKRRVINDYNYAKEHHKKFDKLCRKALKKLNKLTTFNGNITKKDIQDQLDSIECDIKPHRRHLEACYQDLDTRYDHYIRNGGHTLEEIDEFLHTTTSNTPHYGQLTNTIKLIKMALEAK